MYGGFLGWQIECKKHFFKKTIFDPNGPPGENWYFLAYFGIVPLEVDEYVLPMIEHVSFAVCFKTCFKRCFKTFLDKNFSGFYYYAFFYTAALSSSNLLRHSGILHRVRSTADDPWMSKQTILKKDQSRRSGAKSDDPWVKAGDTSQSGRSYRKLNCMRTDDLLCQRERSSIKSKRTIHNPNCRLNSAVGHIIMLVTKKCDGVIFLHIDDGPIGYQHSNIPECDVDDRCVILDTKTESRWH